MLERGVDRIFFAGTSLEEMLAYLRAKYSDVVQLPYDPSLRDTDRFLARELTLAECGGDRLPGEPDQIAGGHKPSRRTKVVGLTGPGGAGKTTLIDELVYRFLRSHPDNHRVAILSHDPSMIGSGAFWATERP